MATWYLTQRRTDKCLENLNCVLEENEFPPTGGNSGLNMLENLEVTEEKKVLQSWDVTRSCGGEIEVHYEYK